MRHSGFHQLLLIAVALGLGLAAFAFYGREWRQDTRPVIQVIEGGQGAIGAAPAMGPVSYADAVARAAPAVVNIYTRRKVATSAHPFADDPLFRYFFGDRPPPTKRTQTSLGSGVILSPQGYVLTNHHVVADADEIELLLADGRSLSAKVIGSDPESDLAVLRVDAGELPVITIGRSRDLRVGDVVLAIGNPFGVGQTVTQGIVSALGRTRLGINTFEDFIQTDAAINPGNSGGALVNTHGELVGINSAIFSRSGGSQGIGFAIPAHLALGVMEQIVEHGRVVRGWIGVEMQEVTPQLAESFGLEDTGGVIVAGVMRGSPAAEAGIRPGDVILAVAGKKIRDGRDALDAIARHAPGERVLIEGIRDRRSLRIEVKVGERPTR